MNIKLIIGKVLTKIGLINFLLDRLNKFGYYFRFNDHECNGISLVRDINQDYNVDKIEVVFDVGASIGKMTKYFETIFKNSKIHSFEPANNSFEELKNNFQQNDRIKLNNFGFSDEIGEYKMYLQDDSGYNSISEMVNKPNNLMNNDFQIIQIKTIDDYCQEFSINQIDFLKIDTEGLDIKVLNGAKNMLENKKIKYIYVECTFDIENIRNTQIINLIEFLSPYGYKVRSIFDQSNWGEKSYLTCVNALFLLQN